MLSFELFHAGNVVLDIGSRGDIFLEIGIFVFCNIVYQNLDSVSIPTGKARPSPE